MIDGQTGYPVNTPLNKEILLNYPEYRTYVVGQNNQWIDLYVTFQMKENTGQEFISVGLLVESDNPLKEGFILFMNNFAYLAADKLNQDSTKDNLLIEQNFNKSFKGGIQKLRLYTTPFSAQEVLHNAKVELNNTPEYGYTITKGGRIIYR